MKIDAQSLKINSSPDYETQSSYNNRLKTTDNGGLSYEKTFTLSVNDIDETDPITGQSFNLDVDGDGKVSAFGDGLMIIRKIFGSAFSGDALTDGAIDSGAERTTQQIHEFIQAGIDYEDLDVDKNGEVTALGD